MLGIQIIGFIEYCKLSGFKDKSIESLSLRLKQFNLFITDLGLKKARDIQYQHLRLFVADYRHPSIHVKKSRIWCLRQFYHYLELQGVVDENIASALAYPKIEKTVPHFFTIEQYNRIVDHYVAKWIHPLAYQWHASDSDPTIRRDNFRPDVARNGWAHALLKNSGGVG